jgi:putative tricarboxylic transport membrane protein
MEKFDRITALFFLILSLGICIGSVPLSLGTLRQPGPGFLSFISGMVMGTFSLILFLKSMKKGKGSKTFWEVKENKTGVLSTIGALILYALLFEYLGFLISTMAFFLFVCRYVANQRWVVSAFLSVLISIIAFVIFDIGFQSQLPKGIIGGKLLWIFGRMSF